jgi:two-component system, NarL family, nitrate/nitrite response regulator NarL
MRVMSVTTASNETASAHANNPVRVFLADDESLFRASLRQLLAVPANVLQDVYGVNVGPGFEVVGEAGTGEDVVRLVQAAPPDLLLLDLCMPRMSGLEALREMTSCRDRMRIILLAGNIDRSQLVSAVRLGVRGLLLKDAPTEVLFQAIMCVLAGQYWLGQSLVSDLLEIVRPLIQSAGVTGNGAGSRLTPREQQVLRMVVAGHSNKEIAQQWTVSEETIKHHLTRMFDKVGAANRVELAMLATSQGLLDTFDADRPQMS